MSRKSREKKEKKIKTMTQIVQGSQPPALIAQQQTQATTPPKQFVLPGEAAKFFEDLIKKRGVEPEIIWNEIAGLVQKQQALLSDSNAVLVRNTLATFFPQWMTSFKQNLLEGYLDRYGDIFHIPKEPEPWLVLGNGPSFHKNIHKIKKFKGKIICCDVQLEMLLAHEIIPDYVMVLDGLPIVADYFATDTVRNRPESISLVTATTCHPIVIQEWLKGKNAGHVYFFHPFLQPPDEDFSISGAMKIMSNKAVLVSGGNCACTAWYLARACGADHIALLGLDLAWYKEKLSDLNIMDLPLTKDFLKGNPKATAEDIKKLYRREEAKDQPFKHEVITDFVKDSYRKANENMMNSHCQTGFRCFQTSNYTVLHPPGFDCILFDEYLKINKKWWEDKAKQKRVHYGIIEEA